MRKSVKRDWNGQPIYDAGKVHATVHVQGVPFRAVYMGGDYADIFYGTHAVDALNLGDTTDEGYWFSTLGGMTRAEATAALRAALKEWATETGPDVVEHALPYL